MICLSCYGEKTTINPQLDYSVRDKYIQNLNPIFIPLSNEEVDTQWGKEYQIGLAFSKQLDLYQAITAFKRADILIDPSNFQRKAQIQYHIINCYYFGKKYYNVIDSFENSILANTTKNFEAFHDMLVILFEAYTKCDQQERADWVVRTMQKFFPNDANKLIISSAIYRGDLIEMQRIVNEKTIDHNIQLISSEEDEPTQFDDFDNCKESCKTIIKEYNKYKKNPKIAKTLNALIPGSGYLYLGQKESAFTAFTLNGLFIATTIYFFKNGNVPAALITLGFESGWYFGGIIGAGEATKLYNEKLFEKKAYGHMRDNKLFPVLMLNYGF